MIEAGKANGLTIVWESNYLTWKQTFKLDLAKKIKCIAVCKAGRVTGRFGKLAQAKTRWRAEKFDLSELGVAGVLNIPTRVYRGRRRSEIQKQTRCGEWE